MARAPSSSMLYALKSGFRLLGCSVFLTFLAAPSLPQDQSFSRNMALLDTSSPQMLAREVSKFTLQKPALITSDGRSAQARNAAIPIAPALSDAMTPFSVMRSGSPAYATALGCLTEAIYYEAANESIAGKRGVAQVILNRVAHPAYPSSVCGVVYQGWREPVCQFSYTCDGSLARAPLAHLWRQSRDVAKAALAGYVEKSVGTATHYHADYVLPYWAYRLEKVHVEGRHIFYRLPGRAGRAAFFSADWRGSEFHPTFDPSRFAILTEAVAESDVGTEPSPTLARDPTERRADNDVGGRLNPASNWRLAIPDPVAASQGLEATLKQQTTSPHAAGASAGSLEP